MTLRRALTRAVSEIRAAATFLAPDHDERSRRARGTLRILTYHAVGSAVVDDRLGIFSVAPALFEQHMAALASRNRDDDDVEVEVVALADAVVTDRARSSDPSRSDPSRVRVAITFDDGYADNLAVAAPVLAQHGFPFAVFVTASFIRSGKPFLNVAQLKELAAIPNATIGAHGATHTRLTDCDDETLREELVASKRFLEDLLGRPITTLAYPYGAVDARVRDAARDVGFEIGVTSYFDINRMGRDPMLLARTVVLGGDDRRAFRQKVRGDWDWYRWSMRDPERM